MYMLIKYNRLYQQLLWWTSNVWLNPIYINSLWPSKTIWRHRSWSALPQVARRHQVITRTNVGLSFNMSCRIYPTIITLELFKILTNELLSKTTPASSRSQCVHSLTHWGRDKMAAVSQTTLSNAFSWMKMLEFRLLFQWSLFLRV